MSQRITYKVHGEVQGVNFRSYTQDEAKKIGVTGFVANAPQGHVSGEAQGDESKINDFIAFLEKGPRSAKVTQVKTQNIEVKSGEKGFEVTG